MSIKTFAVGLMSTLITVAALADNHGQADGDGLATINLCQINEGHTFADVRELQARWIKRMNKKGISLFNELLTPVMLRSGPNESSIDFIDLSISSYADGGRMWADWHETEEGQDMAAEWNEMASCGARAAHLVMKYANQKALDNDSERVVTFTHCEIHEGVQADDMRMVHQQVLDRRSDSATNIAWGLLLPRAGGDDARNVFRHANVYPDLAAYTQYLSTHSERAPFLRNYRNRYASCDLPTVWMSEVMSRQ